MKQEKIGRLWIRIMKGHKATQDLVVPCDHEDVQNALREGLHTLDIGMPVWLPRHTADWRDFSLTRFIPEQFLEPVRFDRMEVSYIPPEEEAKPRRQLDEFDD